MADLRDLVLHLTLLERPPRGRHGRAPDPFRDGISNNEAQSPITFRLSPFRLSRFQEREVDVGSPKPFRCNPIMDAA